MAQQFKVLFQGTIPRTQAFLDAGDVVNGLTCSQERNLSISEPPALRTALKGSRAQCVFIL